MGIAFEAVETLVFLKRQGIMDDIDSMVELGNQHVRYQRTDLAALMRKHRVSCNPQQTTTEFYQSWGIPNYTAIDLNGEDGALKFDLNAPFTGQNGLARQYDLLTNFGTTEHCFDQAMAFENIHNLTQIGGYMAHILPSHGWNGHCFYRYDENFFFDLAQECDYEILFIKYYARSIGWKKYFKMVKKNCPLSSMFNHSRKYVGAFSRDVLISVLFKKNGGKFSYPMQGMYSGVRKGSKIATSQYSTL